MDPTIVSTDSKKAAFYTSLPSLIVAMEPGKRHALRAHMLLIG